MPAEILIFGGTFPLSPGQVSAIAELALKYPMIRGLALNFTRIKEKGLKALCEGLKPKTYKATRLHDLGIYSLDLTNNFLEPDSMETLTELFYDRFLTSGTVFENNSPVPTSIRVLILDFNFLGAIGLNKLSLVIETSRQLKVLSL